LVSYAPYVNEEGANEVDESQAHDNALGFQTPRSPAVCPIAYPLVCDIVSTTKMK
jgi:hypothetical protein